MAKTLTVDIKAQNQELKRKLRESQAYIRELERTAKDSARGVSGSFDGAKSSVSRFTRECRDAGNSISSAFSNLKSGNIEGAVSSLRGISGAAAGAAAGVAAIGTVAVVAGAKIADLVGEGIELAQQAEGIKHRFEEIGGTSIYLESLREHTHGLVNDLELMKATVKAKDFNIPMKDLGTYLEFAQLKAQQTGESVDYLVDSIVTGLGRQSVQILDNLGISAAELKSKMAEGKTMTEAVAEVIDKQLSEAGEHFETTAEKAQRKLIELQNEQMRVGEQLAPLKSDWESFLTSVEIWAMKAVQKLGALIDKAQRIKNLQDDMLKDNNGNYSAKGSGAQLEALRRRTTKTDKQKYIDYRRQKYDEAIYKKNRRINEIDREKKEIKNRGRLSLYKRPSFSEREYTDLIAGRDKLVQERDKFLKGAADIMNPKTTNISGGNTGGGGKSGGRTGGRTTHKPTPLERVKANGQNKFEDSLRKTDVGEIVVPVKYEPTKSPEELKEEIFGNTSTWTSDLQSNIDGLFKEAKKVQIRFDEGEIDVDEAQKMLDNISKMIGLDIPIKLDTSDMDKAKKDFDNIISASEDMAEAMGNIGSSFETPEIEVGALIAQAIAELVAQFASVPKGATIYEWIATTAAGLVTLTTAIASIKSATSGYANGGVIGGSMMHGDQMLARVNSGEMILNGNQQSNLFNMINDGSSMMGGGNVHFVLRGADLYGSMKNFSTTKSFVGKNTGIK